MRPCGVCTTVPTKRLHVHRSRHSSYAHSTRQGMGKTYSCTVLQIFVISTQAAFCSRILSVFNCNSVARSPGSSLRKLGDPTFLYHQEGAMICYLSDKVARKGASSTVAPSAHTFARRATVPAVTRYWSADALSSESALHAPHRLFLPRAVHLARSRMHCRPHTCVLNRETCRDARQFFPNRRPPRRGALRAWAAGWAARCFSAARVAWVAAPHTAEGRGGGDRGTEGQRVRECGLLEGYRVGAVAPPRRRRAARHFALISW